MEYWKQCLIAKHSLDIELKSTMIGDGYKRCNRIENLEVESSYHELWVMLLII